MSWPAGAASNSAFPALLRAHRLAGGLTQEEFAAKAGVGVRTLRDLERGRSRPQRATIDLLAAALGLRGAEREDFLAAARRGGEAGGPTGSAVNLPPAPVLVGRGSELDNLATALRHAALVTLVGVAGVGKTSLAWTAAHRAAARHPGGVAGVVITEVSTEADTLAAVAAVFGVGRPSELSVRLAGRPALLLVDAVERSPETAAATLRWLQERTPSLRVIATGRRPTGIAGEYVWPVMPLECPPPGLVELAQIARYPAAELFIGRLREVGHAELRPAEAAAVNELVRRLAGLPLALELGAARGRIMEVREILDRYGDRVLDLRREARDGEVTTLREAIAGSYRLLEPALREALRRLAQFHHRWSVELAEQMLGDWRPLVPEPAGPGEADPPAAHPPQPGPPTDLVGAADPAGAADLPAGQPGVGLSGVGLSGVGLSGAADRPAELREPGVVHRRDERDVVAVLDGLIGLGLVSVRGTGPTRFRMLDMVRDFAIEQSEVEGEAGALRDRHAAVLAGYAARTAPQLVGGRLREAAGRLDDVSSDLRAALVWAGDRDPGTALYLASKLPRWWRLRGHDREGRTWLRRLLDDPATAHADPTVRAWAGLGMAQLAAEHGDGLAELGELESALGTFIRYGRITGQLAARNQLCILHQAYGDYEASREHGEAVLRLATRYGRTRDVVVAQNNLTWHDIRVGDLATARRRLVTVQRLAAEVGEDRLRALAHANLAEVARLDGRYPEAAAIGRRSLALVDQLGDPRHKWRVIGCVALALAQAGRVVEARATMADVGDPAVVELIEAYLALAEGDRTVAADRFSVAAVSLSGRHDVRDVVEALVGAAASTDDPERRREILVELDELCRRSAVSLLARERALLGR
jgi:predicted ATPase/DNA-binding XRE family transcriptional regulator